MITKHPWFGPKRVGWGWRPVSWEGWLATGLSLAPVLAASIASGNSAITACVALCAVAALLIVCLLTGTGPG